MLYRSLRRGRVCLICRVLVVSKIWGVWMGDLLGRCCFEGNVVTDVREELCILGRPLNRRRRRYRRCRCCERVVDVSSARDRDGVDIGRVDGRVYVRKAILALTRGRREIIIIGRLERRRTGKKVRFLHRRGRVQVWISEGRLC